MSPLTEVYPESMGDAITLVFGGFKCIVDLDEGDTPREVVSKLRQAAMIIEREAGEGPIW